MYSGENKFFNQTFPWFSNSYRILDNNLASDVSPKGDLLPIIFFLRNKNEANNLGKKNQTYLGILIKV